LVSQKPARRNDESVFLTPDFDRSLSAFCLPKDPARENLLRFDFQTGSFQALVNQNENAYTLQDWPYLNQALLASPDGKHWWLDTQTGKIWERSRN
jgi:hypothetical protein